MLESKYLAFDHSYAIEWKECESSMEVLSATLLPILRDRETSATRPCGSRAGEEAMPSGNLGGGLLRNHCWMMLDKPSSLFRHRYTPLIVIAFCGSLLTQRAQENERLAYNRASAAVSRLDRCQTENLLHDERITQKKSGRGASV